MKLIEKYAEVFGQGNKYHYYIFSLGGFTDRLKEYADGNHIRLITLDEMYRKS